eukprot:CAMPEP_0184661824 /NCGR_PEP_ID=MMETSP0308-20130426/40343_1 /TAXON_ID=38269 /ORGANISM="Gloeochaete witrockiana, Strain SAG 46.84" /LENGTH=113 /DNA_ID=CAMNT_0027103405 /DNA_START=1402 /DNA_END=1743 /DNA_ORIENTATION=-
MDNVSFTVNQDVAVMPILDLKQIANDRVSGTAFNEITACSSKSFGLAIATAKFDTEVLAQGGDVWVFLAESIERYRIAYCFDKAAFVACRQDAKGSQPKAQLRLMKYRVELSD